MEHIIKLTLAEFIRISQVEISFVINTDMKSGTIVTKQKKLDFLFRSEVRIADVNRWKEHFVDNQYVLIARKIYANAKSSLITAGIFFFEYDGSFFFQTDGQSFSRDKVSSYDQRSNSTRINGKFGSRVLAALVEDHTLFDSDIAFVATKLNMGVSTMYYYYSALKKQGIIDKILCHDYRVSLRDFTYQNVYLRNYDSTLMGTLIFTSREYSTIRNDSSLIYMAWDGLITDKKSGVSQSLVGYDKQYQVLTNPYSLGCCPLIRNNFRQNFTKWVQKGSLF